MLEIVLETLKPNVRNALIQGKIKVKSALVSKEPQPTFSGTASTVDGMGELATFLLSRGLDPETAVRYGLSASSGRVEIPFVRDGEIIYRKYRTIAEKVFTCDSGHKPFLWNIAALYDPSLEQEPLVITEGEFDALAAIQSGFPRTVSVPNGAAISQDDAGLPYLESEIRKIQSCNEVVIAVDGDDKGQELAQRLSICIGKPRCKIVNYPTGCKDLNDVLKLHEESGVKAAIKTAPWSDVDGVFEIDEISPTPYQQPYDIGIEGFEKHLRIRMGDFSVWTGIPGAGKTTFINDVTCQLADKHGLRIAIASFEQNPLGDHRRNLRTWYIGKLECEMSSEEKDRADAWIKRNFCFIVPASDTDITLDWFLDRAAVAVIRKNAKIVVLDPWNEMDHVRPNGMTLTEYTGYAIKRFKAFAKKYGVHIAVIAHPAKLQRRREDGKYPVPSLYDISDSAHWFNKPDLGVVIHREAGEGDFVQIAKSRYHTEIGKTGIVDVRLDVHTGRYAVVDNNIIAGKR